MSVADWVSSGVGLLGVMSGGFVGIRTVRSAAAADRAREAEAQSRRIAEARAEERATFEPLVSELRNDRDEALRERDYERTRADNLQTLINQWRIGQGEH